MRLEVEIEFPEVRIATFGPVVLSVWYKEASVRGLEAHMAAHERLAEKYGMASSISISAILPRSPPPEALEWVKTQSERNASTTIESVVVLLPRGLSAVFARTFLATISLFSRQKIKAMKSLEEAVTAIQQAPKQDSSITHNRFLLPAVQELAALSAPV